MSSTQNNNTTNNNTLSTRITTILVIIFAVGGPSTLSIFGQAFITRHPLRTLLLLIGYVVAIVVIGYVSKVGQELESASTRSVTAWIKFRWQMIFSWYYWQLYRQYVLSEHQVSESSIEAGDRLELKDVFVKPFAKKKALSRISSDPLNTSSVPTLHPDKDIWNYLADRKLSQLIIIAASGRGKTTLLKHICLIILSKKPRDVPRIRHTFPILLSLSDHAADIQDDVSTQKSDFSLVTALLNHMQRRWPWPGPESVEWQWQKTQLAKWINHQLAKGRCLILLDGLDEITDQKVREQAVEWIRRQMIAHGSKNRFILTSRPYGFRDNELKEGDRLEILPFTWDQIKQFVEKWYMAKARKNLRKVSPDLEQKVLADAKSLLYRLKSKPALERLAGNPRFLTRIVIVHLIIGTPSPGEQVEFYVELYKQICEDFLKKCQAVSNISSGNDTLHILQLLAFHMMQERREDIDISQKELQKVISDLLTQINDQMSPETFLRMVHDESGLLLKQNGIYYFLHANLQKYLAAVHIKEQGKEQDLVDRIEDDWWHETIRLYCAQADATRIIEACLAGTPPSSAALTLAFDCHEEKLKAQPSVTQHIEELLEKGVEDLDPEYHCAIAKARLTRRLRQMIFLRQKEYQNYGNNSFPKSGAFNILTLRLKCWLTKLAPSKGHVTQNYYTRIYIGTSLVPCIEYQIFLDEKYAHSTFCQPDHWNSISFASGQGGISALGVRSSDAIAFCQWLTERYPEGWLYRLPTKDECKMIETCESISTQMDLAVGTGYWIDDGNNGLDFAWVQRTPPSPQEVKKDIYTLLQYDITLAEDLNRNFPDDLLDARACIDILMGAIEQKRNQNLNIFCNPDNPELNEVLAHVLNSPLDLDRMGIFKFSETIDSRHHYAHAINQDCVSKLILYLEKGVSRFLQRNSVVKPDEIKGRDAAKQKEETAFLRWSVRFFALLLACYLRYQIKTALISPNTKQGRSQDTEIFNCAITHYIRLCISFALLELRIQEKLPASEGILLVREYRQHG